MNTFTCMISALVLFASTATLAGPPKEEEHFDCWIRPVDGAIVTGSITEGAPGDPVSERWRAFGAELGEDEQFPFSATEPGFQLRAEEGVPSQSFTFVVTGPVQRWTGYGFAAFGDTMFIQFGPASLETGPGPIAGFQFAANEFGFIHDHFDFTLIDSDGLDPEPGVYVLGMSLEGVEPAFAASRPFFFVFNLGEDEEVHEAAIEHADLFLACSVDLDGSGVVDGADLGELIGRWSELGDGGGVGDLDHNGVVDAADLGVLLAAWGHACT